MQQAPPSLPRARAAPHRVLPYGSAVVELTRLATLRPDLASLSTAQALYELPTAGTCRNADGSRSACLTHVLEITNRATLAADPERPEVLFSGALHGDERVGPVTTIELARWLIERYDVDPWVKRLVDTRVVLCVPMTNAIGVEQLRREELGIDPNRDFPYDQEPSRCMKGGGARGERALPPPRAADRDHVPRRDAGDRVQLGLVQLLPRRLREPRRQLDARRRGAALALRRHRQRREAAQLPVRADVVVGVPGARRDGGLGEYLVGKAFVKPCTPTYGGYSKARTTYTSGQVPPRTLPRTGAIR